jgi:hypothetical protein
MSALSEKNDGIVEVIMTNKTNARVSVKMMECGIDQLDLVVVYNPSTPVFPSPSTLIYQRLPLRKQRELSLTATICSQVLLVVVA